MVLRFRLFRSLAALAFCLLFAPAAQAFRLAPIEMEFDPAGRGATQIFRLENENKEPAAVEIRILARAQDREGEDVLTPADDDWVVFPEQIILEPGQTQSVRVQWIGNGNPPREQAYRLIAEQLPVELGQAPTSGGQVRLLVRYVASLYVRPAGVSPALTVTGAQHVAGPQGKQQLELVVQNAGSARQMLLNPTLALTAGGRSLTLTGPQLEGLAGENILAGTTRRFLLPWPAGLAVGPVTADLRLP
ncbi:molecular chaperone [Oleisolibacter albus]|uniref:fimbrial biogenesis chaperone n=1 Tax=Oleisolibacter albus TaxID=2171757 RepID=UPI000DF39063|nr:fimbria/pilus periplasmic chaperone [Oleisolibacter albus]